ncbi:unnamed protein product [Peniophora sp. CBMAI 1063]|nr:unnamed protein product [Peniophora sp. CBMAI 1063]
MHSHYADDLRAFHGEADYYEWEQKDVVGVGGSAMQPQPGLNAGYETGMQYYGANHTGTDGPSANTSNFTPSPASNNSPILHYTPWTTPSPTYSQSLSPSPRPTTPEGQSQIANILMGAILRGEDVDLNRPIFTEETLRRRDPILFRSMQRPIPAPPRHHNHNSRNVRAAPYPTERPQAAAPGADLGANNNTTSTSVTLMGGAHARDASGVASPQPSATQATTSSSEVVPYGDWMENDPDYDLICWQPGCTAPTKTKRFGRPRFSDLGAKTRHAKTHVVRGKLLTCPTCQKPFKSDRPGSLKRHQQSNGGRACINYLARMAKEAAMNGTVTPPDDHPSGLQKHDDGDDSDDDPGFGGFGGGSMAMAQLSSMQAGPSRLAY